MRARAGMDRHRHRRNGRPERPDLPHRLPGRLRTQRQKAAVRPGPGTVPALERRARRPARLGTATPVRLNPRTRSSDVTVTNTVMPPASMPAHTTSEYLLVT